MRKEFGFKRWLAEGSVKGSLAGEAMKRTLDFKIDAEWIKWDVEPKGWITDRGVKDSFDLQVTFYHSKVPKPAFFYIRAHAILDRPDMEYDSISGSKEMKIKATLFLFNGRTGLGSVPDSGIPRNMRELLDAEGHIRLSERDDRITFPGAMSEFDGPALRAPLQLADWVKTVIDHTDIGGRDDGDEDDEPDMPKTPAPGKGRLVGV